MSNQQNDKLLTPQEVAEHLGVTPETLNTWRATKRYPLVYIKIGRLVRYKWEDVLSFIENRTQAIQA
jgi:excisionase family DNA binding protein